MSRRALCLPFVVFQGSHAVGLLRHHPTGVLGFSQRCAEYPVHSPSDAMETTDKAERAGHDDAITGDRRVDGRPVSEPGPSCSEQRRSLAFEEVALTAQPGDVFVHHSYTLHSAGANNTLNRWACFLHGSVWVCCLERIAAQVSLL